MDCTVYWLTSTGYEPRSRIVGILGKSTKISEVVFLSAAKKKVSRRATNASDSVLEWM